MLPGISGALFPLRYLADPLARQASHLIDGERARRTQTQLTGWWRSVASSCGPATGVRAMFDLVAMPLASILGFRASDAVFDRQAARVRLITPSGATVGLLVLPWAARPSQIWRDAVRVASEAGGSWCFVVAPPFVSLLHATGRAARRAIDFTLPDVIHEASIRPLLMLCHAHAFDRSADGSVAAIDHLLASATSFQGRVREDLQAGVTAALTALTVPGLLAAHEAPNRFDEALTLIYRVLFLLFAESRDLVPHRHPIYRDSYAIAGLTRQAQSPDLAAGLWDALAAITRLSRTGCRVDDLIVRPFNGRLFAREAAPTLERRRATRRFARTISPRDRAMQAALTALATRQTPGGREEICYADLGVEQLGAVYERVLDIDPGNRDLRAAGGQARKPGRHSDERKRSGTFYTPQPLCDFVVRRTLAPLVAGRSADAILALRVVDPAMGSGAFLASACRYLASAYERALIEDGRRAEADLDDRDRAEIRRLIAERCLCGVDANPVAVQLARLSLWLATLAEGKPLGFLDHRLRVGNSLIGASPQDLWRTPGRRRAARRSEAPSLLDDLAIEQDLSDLTRPLLAITGTPDDTVENVRAKESAWTRLSGPDSPIARWRLAADLWCSRWLWSRDAGQGPAPSEPEFRAALDAILRRDSTLRPAHLSRWIDVLARLRRRWNFFHWPLEFADVFYDEAGRPRPQAGFDAVIGNPPWEMLRADGGGAGRPGDVADRSLVRYIRESGFYPACNRGHVNLYQPFLERALSLTRAGGRIGLILPSGLATDEGATALRARLLDRAATDTVVGIDNAKGIFPIHRGLRFLVVCATPGRPTDEVRARFGVRTSAELDGLPDATDSDPSGSPAFPIRLSRVSLELVGGPARRIPAVNDPGDLVLLERIARAFPRLGADVGWAAQFGRELNVTEDRSSFGRQGLPVIEGKHLRPFAVDTAATRFRIDHHRAGLLLPGGAFSRARLAYRDVSGVGNRTSLIAAIIPPGVVTTHTLFCLRGQTSIERQHYLCALFNSYVLNFVVRALMGGHLTTALVENLPVPIWTGSRAQRLVSRLAQRVAESGSAGLHARLQGAAAREYGVTGAEFERVLAAFPLVPRGDRDLAWQALRRVSRTCTGGSGEAEASLPRSPPSR